MLTIPVEIKKSQIHGYGVFAVQPIRKGSVVWMFTPGLDQRVSETLVKYCEPRTQEFIRKRGYINPTAPDQFVLCIDESQLMNFPPKDVPANLYLGDPQDGENILLAAVDIVAGEELTVPPESDADYTRKMQAYGTSG